MARQKKEEQTPGAMVDEALAKSQVPAAAQPVKAKLLAKIVQMVVGVDLLGSKMSLQASKSTELEITPIGIKAHSKSSNRTVLIPWTNIKGAELLPE